MHTLFSNFFILLSLSLSQLLLQRALVVVAFDESDGGATAHFADVKRGRMSWVVEDSLLPWVGQYYYIESAQSPMTNLLTVVDSANGNHLGNCASYAPRDSKWRKFFWTLTKDALICNITDTETAVSKIHFSPINSRRTFSIRILAQQGPRCFRNMIVQNEKLHGCPPKMNRNFFLSMALQCECDVPTRDRNSPQMRNTIAPFHFANPRITSSNDSSSSILHDRLSPGAPTSGENLNAEMKSGVTVTTDTDTDTDTDTVDSLETVDNEGMDELLQSVPQQSHLSTATDKSLSAPTVASDVTGISEQVCAGIQCQNNGTCIIGNDGRAVCVCQEGFLGTQCEVNLCANVECMHGGVCQASGNVPHCQCRPGTTGTLCEEVICNPKCEQNGTCEVIRNVPTCRCPARTFGINCNIIDTCNSNKEACIEYGSDARCQLDSDNFALISPVPVNATYKCLCLNEQSEWTDCKELRKKVHLPAISTIGGATVTVASNDTATSAFQPETQAQPESTQHIAPLFQNNLNLSNLLPTSPITNVATTAVTHFVNPMANFHQSDRSKMETFSSELNRPAELLPKLLSTIPKPATLLDTTTPITSDSRLQQQQQQHVHHQQQHFNLTVGATPPALSEHAESQDTTSTGSKDVLKLKPDEMNFDDMSKKFSSMDVAVESSRSSSVREFLSTVPSTGPEVIIDNTTVAQLESTATVLPSVETPQVSRFEQDGWKEEEKLASTSETDATTENGSLSTQLTATSTTPKIIVMEDPKRKENWNWFPTSTKLVEKMEQTTIGMDGFTAQSKQAFDEDEVKFVKLTVGLPTTTLIPEFVQPSDSAFSDNNNTTRSDTSSWTIVLAIIFALMILAGACVTLIFRYVRRSRKLHGKYNPAREESMLSSSYSMPMATVTKEERLI